MCIALALQNLAAQDPSQQQAAPDVPLLNPQQLDDLVAPIALYPDPLIAQILAAATYPLEVVEADRWLQSNTNLQGTALTDAAQSQPWDPSVQALVVFPTVLAMMDRNLKWTTDLGNAFLAQQGDVMDAIQRQRQRAQAAGKLASNEQQTVQQTTEDNKTVIVIEPAQPQTIYVPVYDPVVVWGPPVYHPWPAFWFPPRPAGYIAAGAFGFFVGVTVGSYFHSWGGWNNWGWGPGWGSRNVVINNNFYVRNNFRVQNNYVRNGRTVWTHNPEHRAGVPYSSRGVANRVGAAPGSLRPAPSRLPPGNFSRPAQPPERPENRPAVQNRPGEQSGRSGAGPAQRPGGWNDRSAFGGSANGDRARIENDRGHASLGNRIPGHTPQSQPRPAPQARPASQGGQAPQARPAPGSRPGQPSRQPPRGR